MDEIQKRELHIVPPPMVKNAAVVALGMLAFFLFVLALSSIKEFHYIGSGVSATNTITVEGMGEVFAVPDTTTFSYSVMDTKKDVTTAQTSVNTKGNDIIAYLKEEGIDEKDIQTTDYSVNPQYEYNRVGCTIDYCPSNQTLIGYQVSQTVTVKVKEADKAGELLSGIGSKGATNMSGLSFTIDDETGLKSEARAKAIQDARTKADALAKDLKVSLVRIVGFSEGGGAQPYYYAKEMSLQSAVGNGAAPAADIAVGQNKIQSNVSVTYEIR
jgi:uncharacterized protein